MIAFLARNWLALLVLYVCCVGVVWAFVAGADTRRWER